MKKLAQTAIGTGAGTLLYTVPSSYRTEVLEIDIANTTSGSLTCALHVVPVGVAVSDSNMLLPTISIPANTLVQWKGIQAMNAGDFIQAIGSGSGLTANITGQEIRVSV